MISRSLLQHLKIQRTEAQVQAKAAKLYNTECGEPGSDCFDDVDCNKMSQDLE